MVLTEKPRVAVTGATGLVGRHLCAFFAAQGWSVRRFVRDPEHDARPIDCGRPFQCDLPDKIDPAGLEGVDLLIHTAYATRGQALGEAHRVNEEGSRRLFDLAARQGVGQIIFISSFSARPDARSYYGRSKFAVERLLRRDRDLALRSGLVLAADGGLFFRIVESLRRARLVPLVGGRRIVQTLHIDDLCQACQTAAEKRLSGVLHLAEPRGQTFGDLMRLVLTHLKRRCVLLPTPFLPVWAGLRLAERLQFKLGVTTDNLLGIQSLRHIQVGDDLARLGVAIKSAEESITSLLSQLPEPTYLGGSTLC